MLCFLHEPSPLLVVWYVVFHRLPAYRAAVTLRESAAHGHGERVEGLFLSVEHLLQSVFADLGIVQLLFAYFDLLLESFELLL